jgi:hypothetical protein
LTTLSIVEGGNQLPIVEAAISTRELKPAIGTVVEADTAMLLGGTVARDIRALLDERSVLVFPGLGFDDERQIAFTQTLGVQAFENNGVLLAATLFAHGPAPLGDHGSATIREDAHQT